VIDISYSPPDQGYHPPYYRTLSTVTLTCRAVGVNGLVRYNFSCGYCSTLSEFYYRSSGISIISKSLTSRNAGTFTCSAYYSGVHGSASTMINIVGECAYKTIYNRECQVPNMHSICSWNTNWTT